MSCIIVGNALHAGQRIWVRDAPEQLWRRATLVCADSQQGVVIARPKSRFCGVLACSQVFCEWRLDPPLREEVIS